MESNITLIRNLVEDNKTYKHVSEILRQYFPEVTRGFSERAVEGDCDTEFTGVITDTAGSPFTTYIFEKSSTRKVPLSEGRIISASSSEWIHIPCCASSLNIMAKFVTETVAGRSFKTSSLCLTFR